MRTRYVRIIEYTFHVAYSFRIEFYGCPIPKTVVLPTLVPTAGKGTICMFCFCHNSLVKYTVYTVVTAAWLLQFDNISIVHEMKN